MQVLEGNLRRVIGSQAPGGELRALSRQAMRSYARYWLEAFRLPVMPAERLIGVDATHWDWIGAQHAEGLNESVRDLLANTVKDELAIEELRMLTERTAQAREALQESVREANLAAETLALPDDKDS